MTLTLNIKYFLYLHKHKNLAPRTISKSVLSIYEKISIEDIYTRFIFYIFFRDINTNIKYPIQFRILLNYPNLLDFIQQNLFNNTIPILDIKNLPIFNKPSESTKLDLTQKELYEIFRFLLNIENYIHNLYTQCPDLYNNLIYQMNSTTKNSLLDNKITPLLCLVIQSMEIDEIENNKDYWYLLKSIKMSYLEGFDFISNCNINHKLLEKDILYSKYKIINEYHKYLINYFPELIYITKLSEKRLDFYKNPLNIPLEYKILKKYIFCVSYYYKIINSDLNDSTFDILIRIIYIEKIFKIGLNKKWCKLIHVFILDNQNLIYILLRRKFDIKNIKYLVKYVPSFHLSFDLSLKFYQEMRDDFYLKILKYLLIKYPVKEFFYKILSFENIFPDIFINKFRDYFNELKSV